MSEPEEIKDALIDAINDHDLEALLRCYSPQAVLVSPTGMAEGHDQISSFYGYFFEALPDLRVTPWSMIERGDGRVHEWCLSATHLGPFLVPGGGVLEPTGRKVNIRVCSVRTVENGLTLSHRYYFDQLELFVQLGAALSFEEG